MYNETFSEPHKQGLQRLTGGTRCLFYCNEQVGDVQTTEDNLFDTGKQYTYDVYEFDHVPALGEVINAIIASRYTADAELAVINNHLSAPTDEHEADFAAYQQYRAEAKKMAKAAMGVVLTDEEIMAEKVAAIDAETDRKILRGHVWSGNPVWLSSENQFNYKAAYDIAVQTSGANLPITYKLGERDGENVFHTFQTVEELQSFYLSCVKHINDCLQDGWRQKEALKPATI